MKRKAFVSGLLLAAGLSSRFGRSKQMEEFDGEALVRRALGELRASEVDEVIVVLGNQAAKVKKMLGAETKLVTNADYRTGLSSSLKRGIASLDKRSEAVVVVLSDQPFVTRDLIDRVVGRFRRDGAVAVAAAAADGLLSPPVLMSRSLYPKVLALSGDKGAKSIVMEEPGLEKVIVDRETLLDIDTEEDLEAARSILRKRARAADRPSRGPPSSKRSSSPRPKDSRRSG